MRVLDFPLDDSVKTTAEFDDDLGFVIVDVSELLEEPS